MGIYGNMNFPISKNKNIEKIDEDTNIYILPIDENDNIIGSDNLQSIEEGTIFLSKTGREVKNDIKSAFNKFKEDKNIKGFSNLRFTHSPATIQQLANYIKKATNWKLFYQSGVQSYESTVVVGYAPIIQKEFRIFITAIKGDYAYNISIKASQMSKSCNFSLTEVKFDDSVLPFDVLKFAADNANGYRFEIYKKAIDIEHLGYGGINRNAYSKIIEYCAKKHKDLKVKEGALLSTKLKFSKNN